MVDQEEKTQPDATADTTPPLDPGSVELASLKPQSLPSTIQHPELVQENFVDDPPEPPQVGSKQELLTLSKADLQRLSLVLISDGNTNVAQCTTCFRCKDCIECGRCFDCDDCFKCTDCQQCSSCVECTQCLRCIYCSDCHGCVECIGIAYGNGLCMVAYGIQLNREEYDALLSKLNAPDEEPPDSSEGETSPEDEDEG